MELSYRTDDNQELDEPTFWAYVEMKVREVYGENGAEGVKPLYQADYWGDVEACSRILKQIIDNQLYKISK